jgi:hypothetical protein
MAKGNGNGTSGKTAVRQRSTILAKRAQPHGGALLSGGLPGNRGGVGKMPETLRIRSRDVYDKWLDWADKAMDDPGTPPEIRMQIGNTAGRYGLGEANKIDMDEVRERLGKQIDAISATYPPAEAEKIIAVIRPAWAAA